MLIPTISSIVFASNAKVSRWRSRDEKSTKGAIRSVRGGTTNKIYPTTLLLEEPYFSTAVEEICRGIRLQWLKRHSSSMWWINLPKLHQLQHHHIYQLKNLLNIATTFLTFLTIFMVAVHDTAYIRNMPCIIIFCNFYSSQRCFRRKLKQFSL